jgi:hypothetical protein
MRDPSIACFLDSTVDFGGEQQVLHKPLLEGLPFLALL